MPTDPSAGDLCRACGLCCNGVMFHTVRLQPADSAKELAALGLKLKRKKGQNYILQPCPAWRDAQCSIYHARPERCRVFECQQLKRVASGEITAEMALGKIREVQRQVAHLNELMAQAGRTDPQRALSKRYEKILAEPLDPTSPPAVLALREALTAAFKSLEAVLDADFRIVPREVVCAEKMDGMDDRPFTP
jgi:Fe-S-cluster containining protein